MYYVYIIRSTVDQSIYIGYSNDLKKRLTQHNRGESKYTKSKKPWEIIYYEAYSEVELAKAREKNLKYFGKAYAQLKRRIGLKT